MAKAPGRDARTAMERLVRLASVLHHAGDRGVPAANLLDVAGWKDSADGVSALGRDFRHLAALGWQIDNIAGHGLGAVYRMRTVDNRLRLKLSPEQQAALRRAVLLVDRADLADRLGLTGADKPTEVVATLQAGDHAALDTVIGAVRRRALLHFRYKGTERVVHPESVRTYTTQWYLRGREVGGEDGDTVHGGTVHGGTVHGDSVHGGTVVKNYVVGRMLDVRADAPGTAERPELTRHPGLHPMSWRIDPPVEATVRTTSEYVDDVRRWLGEPIARETPAGGAAYVDLTYRVTNRSAFRARIYQLGTRVTVTGPDEVRQEILHELATMAGE